MIDNYIHDCQISHYKDHKFVLSFYIPKCICLSSL
uniref:Uncharacterized protein n=1 Tax=Anguilla anguilla TaxID=7936 RepID=A0A0E9TCF5_ANGAN